MLLQRYSQPDFYTSLHGRSTPLPESFHSSLITAPQYPSSLHCHPSSEPSICKIPHPCGALWFYFMEHRSSSASKTARLRWNHYNKIISSDKEMVTEIVDCRHVLRIIGGLNTAITTEITFISPNKNQNSLSGAQKLRTVHISSYKDRYALWVLHYVMINHLSEELKVSFWNYLHRSYCYFCIIWTTNLEEAFPILGTYWTHASC